MHFCSAEQGLHVQADRHRYLKLKGLSPGCRDLLTKMFRANPRDRATVSDIMSHTWFRTDCPQVCAEHWPLQTMVRELHCAKAQDLTQC